jgi:hypothetical protein
MRRHSWKSTESRRGLAPVERCTHCNTERVRAPATKTLHEYRGGKALGPHKSRLPQDGTWASFFAGVIPKCVER